MALFETKEDVHCYSDEDEYSDEETFVAELPKTKVAISPRGRRISVSAAVLSMNAKKEKPVVFSKSKTEENVLRNIISKNWLCAHLEEKEIRTIVDAMEKEEVEEGFQVITQGDKNAVHYYVIEKGSAIVFKDEKEVCQYSDGDAFGELALMYNAPRAATVKTTSKCTLWKLGQMVFKVTLMGSAMRRRERYTKFLEEVPILSEMDPMERMVLADSLKEQHYGKGEEICHQGSPGDEFFIICEGAVSIVVNNQDAGELKVGDYFGEISLLTNKPRQATIVVKSQRVKLLSVHRKVFQRVFGNLSDILKRNMEAYERYLSKSE